MKAWNEVHFENGIDSRENFQGTEFNDFMVLFCYTPLDGNILNESNFTYIREHLKDNLGGASEKSWFINRFSHWTYSYYDEVLINKNNIQAMELAQEISEELEKHGILDEDEYYKLESELIEEAVKDFVSCDLRKLMPELTEILDLLDITWSIQAGIQELFSNKIYVENSQYAVININVNDCENNKKTIYEYLQEDIETQRDRIIKNFPKKLEFGNDEQIKLLDQLKILNLPEEVTC